MSDQIVLTLQDIYDDEETVDRFTEGFNNIIHQELVKAMNKPDEPMGLSCEEYYLLIARMFVAYLSAFAGGHTHLNSNLVNPSEAIPHKPLEPCFHTLVEHIFSSIDTWYEQQNAKSPKSTPPLH
jgi:hypothetical protein